MTFTVELAGDYRLRLRAAGMVVRLTIGLDGRFEVFDGYDMGTPWRRNADGTVERDGDLVRFRTERRRPCPQICGDLRVHRHDGVLQLVPEGEAAGDQPRNVFVKQPLPRPVICRDPARHPGVLTAGRAYLVVAEDPARDMLRLENDRRRLRWFAATVFDRV